LSRYNSLLKRGEHKGYIDEVRIFQTIVIMQQTVFEYFLNLKNSEGDYDRTNTYNA
jgi:hypothetical protein